MGKICTAPGLPAGRAGCPKHGPGTRSAPFTGFGKAPVPRGRTGSLHCRTARVFLSYSKPSYGTIGLNRDVEVMLHLFSADRQKSLGSTRDTSRCSNMSRVNLIE